MLNFTLFPLSFQKLIEEFRKFPGVGPKSAARFAIYLAKLSKKDFDNIILALRTMRQKTALCFFCFQPFEPQDLQDRLCPICSNPSRQRILCVVEKETDLAVLQESGFFKGLYFVLGGLLSRLRKEDIKKLRVKELKERIIAPEKFGIKGKFEEIILALNPTSEGEATSLYLERELKPLKIKITRLGKGLPTGGELEYSDPDTIAWALEGRK